MPEYIDREAAIDALRRRLWPNTSPAQKNMLQIAAIERSCVNEVYKERNDERFLPLSR